MKVIYLSATGSVIASAARGDLIGLLATDGPRMFHLFLFQFKASEGKSPLLTIHICF